MANKSIKQTLLEYKLKGGRIILKPTVYGNMYYFRLASPKELKYIPKDIATKIYEGKENGKVAYLKEQLSIEINNYKNRLSESNILADDKINTYSKMTFVDYLRDYLKDKKKLRTSTMISYTNYVDIIESYFRSKKWNNIELQKISSYHIDDFYNHLRNNRGLKIASIQKYVNIIKPATETAYKKGYISKNIYDLVQELESCTDENEVGDAFTKKEFEQFIQLIKNDPLQKIYILTYLLGLRRSEVLGLRWDHIDLNNNTVNIKGNIQRQGGEFIIEMEKNKTLKSTDCYAISLKLNNLLLDIKHDIENNRKIFGNSYNEEFKDYVCVDALGNLYKPAYLTNSFKKIVNKMNIKDKHMSFHSLRHTAGTFLYNETKDIYQTMIFLRHKNIKTTQRYVHAYSDDKLKAVEQVSNAVNF